MSKSNAPSTGVPPHIFESMLRGTLGGENNLTAWKDELQHWAFTAHQLDQLESELKKMKAPEMDPKMAKDIIDFIEKKIRA